jgi:hypothetical protein
MNIVKLDRRHTGSIYFKYRLELRGPAGFKNFLTYRHWAWDTFGPSCELSHYLQLAVNSELDETSLSHRWAWNIIPIERFIYLKSSEDLLLFQLKWT